MTKQEKIKKYFNQKSKLTLRNSKYKTQVKWLVDFMLQEDLDDKGDVTTDTLIKQNKKTTAIIIAKESGVIAGIEEINWLLKKYRIKTTIYQKDGNKIKKGNKILKITGGIKDILKLERTILNILQRMSGIATQTNKLILKSRPLLVSTRKTQWGLLDKKAVVLGGGGTHRLGLYDWILIKDNHLQMLSETTLSKAKGSGVETSRRSTDKQRDPSTSASLYSAFAQDLDFYEIECKTEKQALKFTKQNPGAIMLDNMKTELIKKLVPQIRKINKNIILEASGGITEKNIREYQKTGVDIISLGSLTHSAKALDLSLNIL